MDASASLKHGSCSEPCIVQILFGKTQEPIRGFTNTEQCVLVNRQIMALSQGDEQNRYARIHSSYICTVVVGYQYAAKDYDLQNG